MLKTIELSVITVGGGGFGCGTPVSRALHAPTIIIPRDEASSNFESSGSNGLVLFTGSLMEFDLLLMNVSLPHLQ